MPALTLTPAQRREWRAKAHHLEAVVLIGAEGLTPAVLAEADNALAAHGLIKIRMFGDDRAGREATLAELADRLNAAPVQHIGKLLVLWRPSASVSESPPSRAGAGIRVVKVLSFSGRPGQRPTVKKVRVLGNQRVTAGGKVKRAKVRAVSLKKRAPD
jgi:RNA-binding protein